jgi:2-dehydro-3-deoxygalactonokinase
VSQRPTPAFAAVDWGTSHLRIWLLDAAGMVLAERRSNEGMLATGPTEFAAVLERHLREMDAPDTLPAMICGMAGSRQGWIEVPYVAVPATLSDVLEHAVTAPGSSREIRIMPGVAQQRPEAPDVMRGEETQLAGIAGLVAEGRHVVCMPGTHSKWVVVEDSTITGFGTWLTGELFSLMTKHSILRHAVGGQALDIGPRNPVFRSSLEQALSAPGDMMSRLFRVRAAGLLFDLQPNDAGAALSGLLIGTEIASAAAQSGGRPAHDPEKCEIILVASGALGNLYAEALAVAGYSVKGVDAEVAVRAGLLDAARLHLPLDRARKARP